MSIAGLLVKVPKAPGEESTYPVVNADGVGHPSPVRLRGARVLIRVPDLYYTVAELNPRELELALQLGISGNAV
jgi:hypothetical protein